MLAPVQAVLLREGRFTAAILFGSASRAQLRDDSDLDIATVGDGPPQDAWLALLGRLGQAAGREVHLVSLESASHILRFQVFRDGIRIFDRDPAATARLLERTLTERFDWLHAMDVMDRTMKRQLAAGRH